MKDGGGKEGVGGGRGGGGVIVLTVLLCVFVVFSSLSFFFFFFFSLLLFLRPRFSYNKLLFIFTAKPVILSYSRDVTKKQNKNNNKTEAKQTV